MHPVPPPKRARLSLDRFAKRSAPLSRQQVQDERERQRLRNARIVTKFRRRQRQLQAGEPTKEKEAQEGQQLPAAPSGTQDIDGAATEQAPLTQAAGPGSTEEQHGTQQHKKKRGFQQIAAEAHAKKEAQRKEKEERQRQAAERQRKLEQDQWLRVQRGKQLRKKTARGQPVMRHRIEGILAKLGA